ncbi:MAG: hypothetical protein HFK07_01255 [Clostridia bacterium]|jgi:hypothetical protein|nr:hypothetical protein [Clostridia bacterium]
MHGYGGGAKHLSEKQLEKLIERLKRYSMNYSETESYINFKNKFVKTKDFKRFKVLSKELEDRMDSFRQKIVNELLDIKCANKMTFLQFYYLRKDIKEGLI